MDLSTLSTIGSLLTALLGAIGFFLVQGSNLRKLIESGDATVKAEVAKSRHDLANQINTKLLDLDRRVELLQRESYRKDEAQQLESRLGGALTRLEAKMDRHDEKISHLLSLEATVKACTDQIKDVLDQLRKRP